MERADEFQADRFQKPVLGQDYKDLLEKVDEVADRDIDPSNKFVYQIGRYAAEQNDDLYASDILKMAIEEGVAVQTIDTILEEFGFSSHNSLRDQDDEGHELPEDEHKQAIIFTFPIHRQKVYIPLEDNQVWVDTGNPADKFMRIYLTWKAFQNDYSALAQDIQNELYANGPGDVYAWTIGGK